MDKALQFGTAKHFQAREWNNQGGKGMDIIYTKDIVGRVVSDLVPNNIIDKVSYSEDKITTEFRTASNEFFISSKILSSDPFDTYDGEIVDTAIGRVAFFDITTAKDYTYYKVTYENEPYGKLYNTESQTSMGGEFNKATSYENFKSDILSRIASYFTHEIRYLDTDENPYNEKLSRVRIVAAVAIDKITSFQLMVGASADQTTILRDNFTKSCGDGDNIFTQISNELFARDTNIGDQSIGEYISNELLSSNKTGRQTVSLTVVVRERLYKVGDIVCPYGFDGTAMSRKTNGEPKGFIITSAEFVYKGSYRQKLEMIEYG